MVNATWGIALSGALFGIAAVYLIRIHLSRSHNKGCKDDDGYHLMKKKAHLDDADAQYYIGYLYEMGIGSPVNLGKAFYWYCRSSEHQHAGGLRKVAQFYIDGKGVTESLDKGMWWMSPGNDQEKSITAAKLCRDIERKYGKKPYSFMKDTEFKRRG